MPHVHIIKAGLQTTVQDLGRWGWQAFGVPVAGSMDSRSHRLANALAGNTRDAATLEVTLIGPEIEFEDARVVAVTGADFSLTLDGAPAPVHTAFAVRPGSCLRFGSRSRGTRAYLGVSGGIATPPVLGSRATHLVSRMGGFEGRALAVGDRLPLGPAEAPAFARAPASALARFGEASRVGGASRFGEASRSGEVRVVRGPQAGWFTDAAFEDLLAGVFTVSTQSDRMGFRLHGPRIARARTGEMISDATVFGALQVPGSGDPILLMADRQTTGGYPAIATVISADLPIAGQLGPGDPIAFVPCTQDEALAALAAQERELRAFERG